MTSGLDQLELVQVETDRLHIERIDSGQSPPDWFTNARRGAIGLKRGSEWPVEAVIEFKLELPSFYTVFAVVGYYGDEEQPNPDFATDDHPLANASKSEQRQMTERALRDLYPYLRTLIHENTARLGTAAMLSPSPHAALGRQERPAPGAE